MSDQSCHEDASGVKMSAIELKLGVTLSSNVFSVIEKQIELFYSELISSQSSEITDENGEGKIPEMRTFVPKVETINGITFVSVVVGFGDDKYELELGVPANQVSDTTGTPDDDNDKVINDVVGAQTFGLTLPGDVFQRTKKKLKVEDIDVDVSDTVELHRDSDNNDLHQGETGIISNSVAVNDVEDGKAELVSTVVQELSTRTVKKSQRKQCKKKVLGHDDNVLITFERYTEKGNFTRDKDNFKDKTKVRKRGRKYSNVCADSVEGDDDIIDGEDTETYSVHLNDITDEDISETPQETKMRKRPKRKGSSHNTEKQVKKPPYKRGHGQPKFKCEHCKVMPFNSHEALQKHIARHNFGTLPNDDGLFTCEHCHKIFKSRANLTTHLWIHKERRFHCSDCDKKFVQKVQLQVHKTNIHLKLKPYLCIYCGKSFSQQSGLSYHLGTHEADIVRDKVTKELAKDLTIENSDLQKYNIDEGNQKSLFCVVCKVQLGSAVRWLYHLKSHLESDVKIENYIKENIEDILKENKNFMKSRRIYECQFCDHVSFNSSENTLHKAVHVEEKTFACPHCSQMFSRDSNLKYHIRRIHKRLKCEFCDARFGTNRCLTEHQTDLHDIDPLGTYHSHDCHLCDYKTKQKFRLLFHLDKVHRIRNTNVGTFTCTLCGKIFATKYGQQLHQRTHTNERPFVCVVCNKSYSDPSNLIHHGTKAHPDVPKKTFLKRKSLL